MELDLNDQEHMFQRIDWVVRLVILEDGQPLEERMGKARVSKTDILTRARESQAWNAWTRSNMPYWNAAVEYRSSRSRSSYETEIFSGNAE